MAFDRELLVFFFFLTSGDFSSNRSSVVSCGRLRPDKLIDIFLRFICSVSTSIMHHIVCRQSRKVKSSWAEENLLISAHNVFFAVFTLKENSEA